MGDESSSETSGDMMPEEGWTVTYDGPTSQTDVATGIVADNLGDAFVVGVSTSTEGDLDILLQKYRGSDGELLWTTTWGGSAGGDDHAFGVTIDDGGDLFVVGGTTPSDDPRDMFLGRFDQYGANIWTGTQDGLANDLDTLNGVALTDDRSVVVAGRWTDTHEAGGVNAVLRMYSSDGEILWTRLHDGTAHGFDAYVDVVSAGSALFSIGSEETSESLGENARIDAYTEEGEPLWSHSYDWGLNEVGSAISVAPDGLVVTGTRSHEDGGSDVWAAGLDFDGEEQWLSISNDGDRLVSHGITSDALGNVWITGLTGAAGVEDIWTRSFGLDGQPTATTIDAGQGGASDIGIEICATADGLAIFVAGHETAPPESGGVNVWLRKIIL
jgi:hypothetical protein